MKTIPDNFKPYRRTADFTKDSVPAGLLKDHQVADGVWGRIVVLEGSLTYVIQGAEIQTIELSSSVSGVIEPGVYHHVVPGEDVKFFVEFYRDPGEGDESTRFGQGDTSYRIAGGEAGIRQLCDDFYHFMSTLPEAEHIRSMHRESLEVIADKLTLFLCGWLGGPRKYGEKYGPIHIPMAHRHLIINEPERDAWLLCMQKAVDRQPYPEAFKQYFMTVIAMPAEKVRMTSRSS